MTIRPALLLFPTTMAPAGWLAAPRAISLLTVRLLIFLGLVSSTTCLRAADFTAGTRTFLDRQSDEVSVPLSPEAILEELTASRISAWGALHAGNGPQGRPPPLAASWYAGQTQYSHIYNENRTIGSPVNPAPSIVLPLDSGPSPWRFVQMIKQGHYMMITFQDIMDSGGLYKTPSQLLGNANYAAYFDAYYRPAMEYARAKNLPIAIRGWNWAKTLLDSESSVRGRPSSGDDTAKLIKNGVHVGSLADPFGPIARWQEFGQIWMGHELMKKLQEYYPDPPMVVFLNNNELGMITNASSIDDTCDRLVAQHGTGKDLAYRAVAIREGYAARYAALFASARASFVEPAWRDNSKFVAYNNTAPSILGRDGGTSNVTIGFDPVTGYTQHRMYDGGMPEYYDNWWQAPKKSDCGPWNPQVEASNLIAYQDAKVWAENPNFYWSSIIWDGGFPSELTGSRTGRYIHFDTSPKAKWDVNRYTGMLQFGLWMMRPRDLREFRGVDDLRGYGGLTFDSLVQSVDRVWNDPLLTEFWRFGKLVNNPVFDTKGKHYFGGGTGWPQWLKDMPRWFLLTSNVNTPELSWPFYGYLDLVGKNHPMRVMAMALSLGEAPNRRWLIYAHAPLGAVAGSSVTLPGFGNVVLDYIPSSGSFFTVNEGSSTATALHRGGPAELSLTASARHVVPGGSITISTELRHPATTAITGYTWQVPGQPDRTSATLVDQTYSFATAGERMVTLQASTASGETVVEQIPIWVRPAPPHSSVVIDMPLRSTYSWSGPWGTDIQSGALQTFRYQPNASTSYEYEPALMGGNLVNDPEEGNVLELRTASDGIILPYSSRINRDTVGFSDMAIGFRFKAEDVQRRQLLYSQGSDQRPGMSIYLHNGRIYAGSWLLGVTSSSNWLGQWISAPVVAGRWYQVSFAMADATNGPRAGVASLSLDGTIVGTAAGARLPAHLFAQIGRPNSGIRSATSAHADGITTTAVTGSLFGSSDFFVGRLADFTFSTGAGLSSAVRYLQEAVNVGGESQIGSTGIPFGADAGSTGGVTAALPPLIPSDAPSDPEIYRSYRTGTSFSYALPMPNGQYNVRLMFIEPEDRSTPRTFNVDLQGTRVLTDFNIHATAGLRQGVERSFPALVTNGTLSLAFTGSVGSEAILSGVVVEKNQLTTPGLVGHWRMDETSGATAYDTSGRDRDLKFATEPTWQNGVVLTGTTTPKARTDANFSVGTGNKLTVSLWVRPQGMDTSNSTLVMNGTATQTVFRIALNSLRVTAYTNQEEAPVTASTLLVDGNWHHIALVYDGALSSTQRNRIYIDGVLDTISTENSTTLANYAGKLLLGQKDETTTDPKFTGQMRDLRILTAALSATEIGALAGTVTGTPIITGQPAAQSVTAGQTASFTVTATGTPTPTIQWQRNSVDISGATTATYTTPITVSGDNGATYRAIVRNTAGAVTSQPATLTVRTTLAITAPPGNRTVTAGDTASFSVTATGTPTPSYQWQRNNVDIPGATASTYTTAVTTVSADDGATYRVVVSNALGILTSDPATLTVRTQLAGWRILRFNASDLADPAKEATIWGNSADPDNDGMVNLLEYALGQSPIVAQTAGLPTVGLSAGNRLTLSFQRNPALADISYAVQSSPDLATWTNIATSTAGGAMQKLDGAFDVTETGTPFKSVLVEDNDIIFSSTTKRFLRLKITQP